MKAHGAWIRMEGYEVIGEEPAIMSLFVVFARIEGGASHHSSRA